MDQYTSVCEGEFIHVCTFREKEFNQAIRTATNKEQADQILKQYQPPMVGFNGIGYCYIYTYVVDGKRYFRAWEEQPSVRRDRGIAMSEMQGHKYYIYYDKDDPWNSRVGKRVGETEAAADKSMQSLIMGIIAMVGCVVPIIAVIFGIIGIRTALQSKKENTSDLGKTNAGLILSITGLVCGVLLTLILGILFAFIAVAAIVNFS